MVQTLLRHYKSDLVKVIKELRLPYNIEVLTQIRRDCYHQRFNDPNSLQNNQVLVSLIQYRPLHFCHTRCFFLHAANRARSTIDFFPTHSETATLSTDGTYDY